MLLEARDVTKAFGSFKAVDAASVALEQGDILGLIGPNGAGKSTLFNCLTGDLLATSGKVLFEGQDITNLPPEARAKLGIARSFQVPQTFETMSVLENVMIGAFLRSSHRAEAEARARAVLDRVGMTRLADAPARSLGTPGRKRLEIARALATEPKVLLLDEAVTTLEETDGTELYRMVAGRLPGTIIISIGRPALLSTQHRRAIVLEGAPVSSRGAARPMYHI